MVTVNGPANGSGGFYSVPNFAAQVIFCSATPCVTTGSNPTGWLASNVTINSSSQLTAISPAVSTTGISYPASFFVEVNTVGGTGGSSSNLSDIFTYSVQVPIIFSISPTSGPAGTTITLNGYNFVSGSTVAWIQVSATDQNAMPSNNAANSQSATTYVSGTQLTVNVPTLPNPNGNGNGTTTYVPMVIDPGGNSSIYSQPYNESNDEFSLPAFVMRRESTHNLQGDASAADVSMIGSELSEPCEEPLRAAEGTTET